MAQLIGLNAYKINSMDDIPLASVPRIDFPFAGILVRAINGGNGIALSTGQVCYSQVQVLATGSIYTVIETAAAIASAS